MAAKAAFLFARNLISVNNFYRIKIARKISDKKY